MVTACYLTTAFVVPRSARAAARRPDGKKRAPCCAWRSGSSSLAPQVVIGDQHGLNTLAHQPIKIAAMEAHWDGSQPGEPVLFAWPDEQAQTNRFAWRSRTAPR
jgi:cytochrome d ubiquinol oxidase subunit I